MIFLLNFLFRFSSSSSEEVEEKEVEEEQEEKLKWLDYGLTLFIAKLFFIIFLHQIFFLRFSLLFLENQGKGDASSFSSEKDEEKGDASQGKEMVNGWCDEKT